MDDDELLLPFALYDEDEDCDSEFCSACSNCWSRSAALVLELEVVSVDDELSLESDGGGGPPGPPGPPLAKAFENTFFNSVAWSLVSLPLLTSPEIRSSILDCRSPGDLLLLLLPPLLSAPPFSAESMSSSAVDNAVWSVEEILPEETSDCSSFFSKSSGDR